MSGQIEPVPAGLYEGYGRLLASYLGGYYRYAGGGWLARLLGDAACGAALALACLAAAALAARLIESAGQRRGCEYDK